MTGQKKSEVREIVEELALAMHQSRDSEISGLFLDIRKDIKSLNEKLEQSALTPEELNTIREFVTAMRGANLLGTATKWIAGVVISFGSIVYFIRHL